MKRNVFILALVVAVVGITLVLYASDDKKKPAQTESKALAKITKKEYTIKVENSKDKDSVLFVISVDPKKYYINLEAPFKIKLESNDVKLPSATIKKDAIVSAKPNKKHPSVVKAKAVCEGSGNVEASVRFGFCDDKNCYIRKESIKFSK